jgi:hypothetical protein
VMLLVAPASPASRQGERGAVIHGGRRQPHPAG